jgi:hypothetical protein
MQRNRKLVVFLIIFFTVILSFAIFLLIERDIASGAIKNLEDFHKHHHHHHHEDEDKGMMFYTLEILNHPWNNLNYLSNLHLQIILILFIDLIFLIYIYIIDKPRRYKENSSATKSQRHSPQNQIKSEKLKVKS